MIGGEAGQAALHGTDGGETVNHKGPSATASQPGNAETSSGRISTVAMLLHSIALTP
jgi:hypothetical protein